VAERVLQRGVARRPVVPEAFLALADAAERLGHLADARAALVHYDALRGRTDGDEWLRRARRIADWSMRLGEPTVAVQWLARAREVVPDDVGVVVRLAEAQIAAGDRDGARASLARARELRPDDPRIAALVRRLP
jgi:predicted Zn-dependent protease